jgi:hypothetical protein
MLGSSRASMRWFFVEWETHRRHDPGGVRDVAGRPVGRLARGSGGLRGGVAYSSRPPAMPNSASSDWNTL